MSNKENKDKIIKFLAYDGRINITCINSTFLVEKAREIHDLSPTATAAFGRLLTMTAIMGNDMKSEKDKLTVQLKGDGPIGTMVTVSNSLSKVKGYSSNPLVDVPLSADGKLDVGAAVGNKGFINVIKDIGLKDPYIGMSTLVSGEIAEDFANYFVQSQGQEVAVGLGVLINKDGVKSSGGYMITPMPDATQEDIYNIEKAIFSAGAISKMLDKNMSLEDISKKISGDENIKIIEDHIIPEYECDCSKEYIAKSLSTIGKEQLETILKEDGRAEITCHFCNNKYEFTKEDLENIINNI